MAFDANVFRACLLTDNKNYERFKTSELHSVVSIVQNGNFSTDRLAAEMRRVSKQKWRKYQTTYAYLVNAVPGLAQKLLGKLVRFRTKSLTAGPAGAIVHVLVWESDTGDLADLAHLRVREHVSWQAPGGQTRNYVIPEYQGAGNHYGVGNAAFTPGRSARATTPTARSAPSRRPCSSSSRGPRSSS